MGAENENKDPAAVGEVSGEGGGQKEESFDPKKFNEGLRQTLDERDRNLQETILTSVNAALAGRERADREVSQATGGGDDDEIIQEFSDEMETLNIDEKQSKALLSIFGKFLGKKVPQFKKEVKSEVKEESDFKTVKGQHEAYMSARYPDILNQSSALFKRAQIEFQHLDKHVKESPMATRIAIQNAADFLGLEPKSLANIRAREAHTETGNGGGSGRRETGPSQDQATFAASFGIKSDKFAQKLKIVNSRVS